MEIIEIGRGIIMKYNVMGGTDRVCITLILISMALLLFVLAWEVVDLKDRVELLDQTVKGILRVYM